MRDRHSASPEKPRTVDCSKEREHQEDVNALDLESLQLQDKEIPPEKLTKLELVGSGGFKVSRSLSRARTWRRPSSSQSNHLSRTSTRELTAVERLPFATSEAISPTWT